jgi:hypothetical protein
MKTRSLHTPSRTLLILTTLLVALPALEQAQAEAQQARPAVAASGRASTGVAFNGQLIGSIWFPQAVALAGPSWMSIDYGQPHARGREIFGGLVPYGEVWRLGANEATHLTLDLNARIGDLRLPAGLYTLYLLPRADGADLIVNRQVQQWGTVYDAAHDVGRVPMRRRALPEVVESLTITLVPELAQEGQLPRGIVRIAWGNVEYTADWEATWP